MATYNADAVRKARMELVREIGLDPTKIPDNDESEVTFGDSPTFTLSLLVTEEWAARWANAWNLGRQHGDPTRPKMTDMTTDDESTWVNVSVWDITADDIPEGTKVRIEDHNGVMHEYVAGPHEPLPRSLPFTTPQP